MFHFVICKMKKKIICPPNINEKSHDICELKIQGKIVTLYKNEIFYIKCLNTNPNFKDII